MSSSKGETPSDSRRPAAPEVSIIYFGSQRPVQPLEVLEDLLSWLVESGQPWELVIALDGDRRDLFEPIRRRVEGLEFVRLVLLHSRRGQHATIRAGVAASSGRIIVTFPAYPQVDCRSIGTIVEALKGGADYVVGYREHRRDSVFNRLAGMLFNRMIGSATGVRFRDVGCGVHGARREVIAAIPEYGDTQVFLPVLAYREGFDIQQVPLRQHPGEPRIRVFGPATFFNRFLSLVTIGFLVRFTQKPLRPFGLLGATLFLIGAAVSLVLAWQRLFGARSLADRPMLLLALLLVVGGIQVIVLGLLGELLLYLHFRDQATYRVLEEDRQGGDDEA